MIKKLIYIMFILMISQASRAEVIGYFDDLYQREGKLYVRGWACEKNVNQSIKVHVYVGRSSFEGGTFATQGVADKELNSKISGLCKTVSIPHRFVIPIPKSILLEHMGKKIVIHGERISGKVRLGKALKRTNRTKIAPIRSIHPIVIKEITEGLTFHPLHYFVGKNYKVITNGKVYNITEKAKVEKSDSFSLRGAHSIASDGSSFFSANAVKDIKSGSGAIVQIDMDSHKAIASYKITTPNYSLLSPHDIIFNKEDGYYYYIDSHWNASSDYLVRFKFSEKGLVESNTEALKLNDLVADKDDKFYARSLSIYLDKADNKQKIIITVSSHGEIILVDSFDSSLSGANFDVKEITNSNRQVAINRIAPSGTYYSTGFVFNDVEYYKDYFYGTNYFRSVHCKRVGCAEKFRFVRWKNWDDFEKDNIEDLSYLIQKKRIPYYMTRAGGKLYVTTFPDNAYSEAKEMMPKIYVIDQK